MVGSRNLTRYRWFFSIFFSFCFNFVFSQSVFPLDSTLIKNAKALFVDDYGNAYIYTDYNFSFTKYNALGKEQARQMFTLPFKVQSVQNPLNISAFSENAQEQRFFDANLALMQVINFSQKFGHVKLTYSEDQQSIWVLDESTKRLVHYNIRQNMILVSYPIEIDFEKIRDFMVYDNQLFVLNTDSFKVYTLNGQSLFSTDLKNGIRLRREMKRFYIFSDEKLYQYTHLNFEELVLQKTGKIVDKNSQGFFVISGNKLYLYSF